MGDLSIRQQLESWVNGESIHNDERNECCPDFSCCNKSIRTPEDIRVLFFNAYHKGNSRLVNRMLMQFLGGGFSEENIYIAGLETSQRELD